ncbi:hypothetical protein [Sphingomonas sp. Leaf33]|nr:hypothetical protein [Sphingomonas sp. Leaf33]
MDEVGLRVAGHLPQSEPRELIEALTGKQCGRWSDVRLPKSIVETAAR